MRPNGAIMIAAHDELADRHLQRRDRAHRQPGEEHRGRVAERDAEHGERGDEIAAALYADEQRDADEADADADQPRPGDALGDDPFARPG